MVIGALEKCVLLMCEENRVCESLMARVKRFSPSSGTGEAQAPRSICVAAAALDTIITFNSDRMRIYGFYVFLLWMEMFVL